MSSASHAHALWDTLKSSALTVVEAGPSGGGMSMSESLMNTQLASALMGSNDAKFFEDSISPSTVRQKLTTVCII